MSQTKVKYSETESDIQNAYDSGVRAAKGGFARWPQFHCRYEAMWQAWLDGYDSIQENQDEQH